MGVFRQFPYSNFHEMNMDEIIKIIKNMLEEWANYHAEWDAWMDEMEDDWSNYQDVMNKAWQNMQDFINNYFDNLDVQEEINNKIVSMIQTGEFGLLVNEYIPPAVNAWLNLNITQPTGVVIDTSLTVAGACADAKATGDAINDLKTDVEDLNDAVFIAFDKLEKYLYKRDTYIDSALTDTPITGYDTYRIPLNDFDVMHLSWDSEFWTGIAGNYLVTVEFSDHTRQHETTDDTYGSFKTFRNEMICLGKIPDTSDVIAFYITAKQDLLASANVKVAINFPYVQRTFDIEKARVLDSTNNIQSKYYYTVGKDVANFNDPYYANWLKLKANDKIIIGKTIAGFSSRGVVVYSDGTIQAITDTEFVATETCFVCIYNSSAVSGDIEYIPETVNIIDRQYAELSGVAFGTSLTYRAVPDNGYLDYLPELTGMTFDNQGVGSSYILGNMLTKIKAYTDYNDKNVCLLEGFVNDWYHNKTLGQYTDTAETTVCGCVRSALNYMLAQNADMTIFLILDHYGKSYSTLDCRSTAENAGNLTQYEYYEEIAKVANSLGIPVIKLYAMSQISENTPQYLSDNIHPTQLGAKQTAYAIWAEMRKYFPNQVA